MSYSIDDYNHDLEVYKSIYREIKDGIVCDCCYIDEIEFRKIFDKNRKKKLRYRKWFDKCIDKYKELYFITLTFNEDYICSEAEAIERLKQVISELKPLGCECRFNVDYGSDFGRLHFHGVSNIKFGAYWNYGFSCDKLINFTSTDIGRITTYVNKIVNHAFKSSTNGRVIRSYLNDGRRKKL